MGRVYRLKIKEGGCKEIRESCGIRYPARSLCFGWKRCPCWDDEIGCKGIIEIRESLTTRLQE